MTSENPSLPPANDAAIAFTDALSPEPSLEPRHCPAKCGAVWLQQGFLLYLKNAGTWASAVLFMALIHGGLLFVPVIGPLLPALLLPVWLGGLMLGCVAVRQERNFHFRHLFTGFEANSLGLLKLGLFAVAAVMVAGVLAVLVFGLLSGGGSDRLLRLGDPDVVADMAANPAIRQYVGLAYGVFLVVLVVPLIGLLFSPALVVLRDVAALVAIKASFRAFLRNFSAIFLWLLLSMAMVFILILPVAFLQPWGGGVDLVLASATLLLLILLLPVLITSIYCMVCDVFPALRWQPAAPPT